MVERRKPRGNSSWGFFSLKGGNQVGFLAHNGPQVLNTWEDSWFFLVERVFFLVYIGFVGVHSCNVNRRFFLVQTGFFLVHLGVFW